MMRRYWCGSAALLILAATALPARAQIAGGQPRAAKNQTFEVDALARYEWTTERFGDVPDERRGLFRILPHLQFGRDRLIFGIGGDFHYTPETEPAAPTPLGTPDPQAALTSLADNYARRDQRVDLVYLRLKPFRWLGLQGGRFKMPVGLTEMLWDADLRPQGGAASVDLGAVGGLSQLSVSGLWARGSHVFEDEKTDMLLASATAGLWESNQAQLQVTGSYLQFRGEDAPGALTPRLYRQNTLTADGALANGYRIADIVVRHVNSGPLPLVLYADYCWNTAVEKENRGLWVGLVLGSTLKTRTRWEYTYARVDRDATLGAYAQDDFLWATGWEAHRGEMAYSVGASTSFHVIASLQRQRASADPLEAAHWARRLRVEWRFHSMP